MIGITEFLIMLVSVSPALVLWIAVIVFAAVMLRRGGGRAERFLITGAGLKIIGNLLRIPAAFITLWLVDRGYSMDYAKSVSNYCGMFLNIIGMAGILCLVYAFWIKFKTRNLEGVREEAKPPSQTSLPESGSSESLREVSPLPSPSRWGKRSGEYLQAKPRGM